MRELTAGPTREAVRTFVEDLCKRHRSRVTWPTKIRGASGTASWCWRAIAVTEDANPKITLATGLHEIGHILAGRCPNSGRHQRDLARPEWWACLACEVDAWREALGFWTFDAVMFEDMRGVALLPQDPGARGRGEGF